MKIIFDMGCNEGQNLKIKYKKYSTMHKFIKHSAGPYGDDLPGKYFDKLSLLNFFLNNIFGWIDICCTTKNKSNLIKISYNLETHKQRFRTKLKNLIKHFFVT
jgi:hypothetical protein